MRCGLREISSFALVPLLWGCLSDPPTDAYVTKTVEEARAEHELPAIAVAIIRSDGIVAVVVDGERSIRTHEAVQADDRWHLGACTKAMTATMIASLVEHGDLSWKTTVLKVFPELKGVIREEFERVTFEQLLSHRAGVLPFTNPGERELAIARDLAGDSTQQRRVFLERLLKEEPLFEPGEEWAYSNAGYAVAAAMAEKVSDLSWRDLIIKYVFDPLEMKHSGFGMPLTDDRPNQPWGHMKTPERLIAIPALPKPLLPPVLESAGDVHCSIGDLARFVQMHLRGLRGKETILSGETIKHLHKPQLNDYAMGWFDYDATGETATAHHGSAGGLFFAWMHIWPERDLAIVIVTNAGHGEQPLRELTATLFEHFTADQD